VANDWSIDETTPLSAREAEQAALEPLAFDAETRLAPLGVVLHDVTIHDVKRLFGSANVRIDAIAVTVPAVDGSSELYQPKTFTFPAVSKGARLPIDAGLLLYLGQPQYFLDLSITASPAKDDAPDLDQLLRDAAPDAGDAFGKIAALAMASPQALAIGAAATAAGHIASMALGLLRAATGNTIGLYRTTWFEHRDAMGLGRHPIEDMTVFRANDLEFWYEIFRDAPPTT
jgi:hypothetical protein